MFYDEEQFFRGGEFDEEIEQLKETLKKSVRKEVLDELEKLRAENKELQGIKANFEKIKRDYEDKKRECDRVMFDAESKAKRARLSEIMEQHKLFLYSPGKRQAYKAKCDKCDRWRQVKVPLPSGRVVEDRCSCYETEWLYFPEQQMIYEIADRSREIISWYKKCGKNPEEYFLLDTCSTVPKFIVDHNVPFEEIPADKPVFFTTWEECEAYCKYLSPEKTEYLYNQDGSLIKQEAENE